jgi:hypothetical protein
MGHLTRVKKIAAGIGVITTLTAMTITPAFAADNDDETVVTASIIAGSRHAEVANFAFDGAAYSFTDRTIYKNDIDLTVTDESGTHEGWQVTMYATDLSNDDEQSIPADGFVVTAVDGITQTIGGSELPVAGSGVGINSLSIVNGGQVVLTAAAGTGSGAFIADVDFNLEVPGNLPIDTYTGTLTTTFGTAPGV